MFRRLRDYPTLVIKTFASSTPNDLVKIARAQNAHFLAVEFREPREQDRSDWHIHAHTQRIRPTNNFEQSFLREAFDQNSIFRQQTRMVQTDAMSEKFLQLRTV